MAAPPTSSCGDRRSDDFQVDIVNLKLKGGNSAHVEADRFQIRRAFGRYLCRKDFLNYPARILHIQQTCFAPPTMFSWGAGTRAPGGWKASGARTWPIAMAKCSAKTTGASWGGEDDARRSSSGRRVGKLCRRVIGQVL